MSAARDELRSQWALADGWPIFARVSVDPPPGVPPVVLVHGFAISGRSLLPTAVRLAPHFPTFVPDLPGFGRSPKPERALTVPDLAETLAAWLAAVGLGPAILVGNSMGCQVIAELAVRRPALVDRAILTGPSGDRQVIDPVRLTWRTLLDGLREPLGLVAIAVTDYLRFGPIRALRLLASMNRHSLEAQLRQMTVPTMLVVGERDPIVPPAEARRLAAATPGGRLVVLPGVWHGVTYAAPDRLVRLIRAFAGTAGDDGAVTDVSIADAST